MRTFRPKDLLPLTVVATLFLFAGGLHAEVTDFPPGTRQPDEGSPRTSRTSPSSRPDTSAGAQGTVRTREDARDGDYGSGEPESYILGDEYWQAAYEYCRSHGGRMIDGGRLCIM